MKKLTSMELDLIAGSGIGLGEALEDVAEAIIEIAHGGDGGVALGEALDHAPAEHITHSGVTHDKDILNIDMISANMDMHDILFHHGNSVGLQKDLNALTSDQRVHYDVHLGGYLAGPGTLFHDDVQIKRDPDVLNIDTYSANLDRSEILSGHATPSDQTDINQLVHDHRTHYDVKEGKFVAGPGER
ncbi:hypothetical protein EVT38_24075 [Salmonella enterica subsp. enterica serovar Java]|uniref:Uncharacterized protein n=4 Tax=Salmonella enterica TaxID=28901 RepID=A0A3Z3GGW0_SALEB|nr:hypothetical protein [Salmonella enterica]EBW4915885.1 hypothetical protein [Salmonella enterica subsp. enterica serovar Vom]EBY0109781.1 hypothetical protein [Salmonella enterica subsp. enterica serovar Bahati]ECA3887089.1 hypothetical protein [Salmonella enterica subsp. enterica serovar Infantis]EDE1997069.1 hypothetical protein [Salmonella enterica subsp. enterica serovar Hissar]EDQ7330993.1 hypothetical protein [Salmonella enterica subsp. enterica serovar Paratyphi C]EEJ2325001.1 hypot